MVLHSSGQQLLPAREEICVCNQEKVEQSGQIFIRTIQDEEDVFHIMQHASTGDKDRSQEQSNRQTHCLMVTVVQ